jgi:hypothetical protein
MPDFRHFILPGGSYFFTVITRERRPIGVGLASLELYDTRLGRQAVGDPADFVLNKAF